MGNVLEKSGSEWDTGSYSILSSAQKGATEAEGGLSSQKKKEQNEEFRYSQAITVARLWLPKPNLASQNQLIEQDPVSFVSSGHKIILCGSSDVGGWEGQLCPVYIAAVDRQ